MSKLNISLSVPLLVPLPQSNGGGVYGYHHGGSEGSNQRAGEADTERRPIQVSHLHGEYAHYLGRRLISPTHPQHIGQKAPDIGFELVVTLYFAWIWIEAFNSHRQLPHINDTGCT